MIVARPDDQVCKKNSNQVSSNSLYRVSTHEDDVSAVVGIFGLGSFSA